MQGGLVHLTRCRACAGGGFPRHAAPARRHCGAAGIRRAAFFRRAEAPPPLNRPLIRRANRSPAAALEYFANVNRRASCGKKQICHLFSCAMINGIPDFRPRAAETASPFPPRSKTLTKLIIESRVPRREREQVPVHARRPPSCRGDSAPASGILQVR